ncbi:MAG: T9SS type A sorting domain-containing protein [Bacteroidia bacterium]
MKKLVVIFIILFLSMGLSAQNCTPDQNITEPGIYPASIDTAIVGSAYEHVLQILAIRDTSVTIANQTVSATVDSIVLHDVLGMPNSFSFSCEPSSCAFTYQAVGCIKFSGQPTSVEEGEHPLELIITTYAKLGVTPFPVKDTLRNFTLVVQDSNLSNITELAQQAVQLYPNPIAESPLKVYSRFACTQWTIYNEQGQMVDSEKPDHPSTFDINMDHLVKGVYYIHFNTSGGSFVSRILRL